MPDVINRDAYTQLLRKVNPALGTTPAQAAPAEAKAGKPAKAPLDTRPPAARNKPKPKHAKTASKRVPKHLRGRGLISEKAMAAMSGPQNAAKARPWQGQKLPGWAASTHGKHDAAAAKSANIKKPKHSKFAKLAGHNPPKPTHATEAPPPIDPRDPNIVYPRGGELDRYRGLIRQWQGRETGKKGD